MKENFDLLMPSVNFFGSGVIAKIGDRAKMVNMSKVLIVTDKFLEKMDPLNKPFVHLIKRVSITLFTTE